MVRSWQGCKLSIAELDQPTLSNLVLTRELGKDA